MKVSELLRTAFVLILFAVATDCAQRSIEREEAVLSTPMSCYLQGKHCLSQLDLQEARRQFQRACSMDTNYAPAYEGLGLVEFEKGNLHEAGRYFQQGRQKDDAYAPLCTGMGRILSAQGKDNQAVSQYRRALELDPDDADAFYYLGKTYVNLGKYSQAEECFKKAVDREPGHVQASEDWALLVRLRTSPQDLPPEYVAIVKKPVATRADFAALLAHQISLSDFCAADEQELSIPDIATSWARREIQQVVSCGLMSVWSNGEFSPSQKITRLQIALTVGEVFIKATGDLKLISQFVDMSSPYSDVSEKHEAFGSIMLATIRGIMKARADGSFGPDEAVTGYAAMNIVRQLKNQL